MGFTEFLKAVELASQLAGLIKKVWNYVTSIGDEWKKLDTQVKNSARSIGLSKEQAEGFRKTVIQSQMELGILYNLTKEEMLDAQNEYADTTGKALRLNRDQLELFAMTSKTVGKKALNDLVASVDQMGGSFEMAATYSELAYNNAQKFGLNASKTAGNFAKNFKAVSKLRFREGVSDLMKMTMLSDKFKVNFDEISKAIDNFDTIEDAITNASKIQMLGGNMAYQFGNPLAAMAEAQTDAAGFMDRMIESVKGLATWNEEEGIAKIEGWIDQTRVKEFAKALGISSEELKKMATQSRKFEEVEKSLGNDDKEKLSQAGVLDAIENLARKKDGKWVVQDANGEDHELSKIAAMEEKDIREFLGSIAKDDVDTNVKDIAQNVKAIAKRFGASTQELFSFEEKRHGAKETIQGAKNAMIDPMMQGLTNVTVGTTNSIGNSSWFDSVTDWLGKWMGYSKVEGAMPTYNQGGIIGGHQESGDKILAGVNSKEMVLTQAQQKNLYDQIQSNPNTPKFSDGGVVGSKEQQDLFKYANTSQQDYADGNRTEIRGNVLKHIGYITSLKSVYQSIENTRKSIESAKYAKTDIKILSSSPNAKIQTVNPKGFDSEKSFKKALMEVKKSLWKGDIQKARIKGVDGKYTKLTAETAIPKTAREQFSKTLIDFTKSQKEVIKDFKSTSTIYQKTAKIISGTTSSLRNFKYNKVKPKIESIREFGTNTVQRFKNTKIYNKLTTNSFSRLINGTFKSFKNAISNINPKEISTTILNSVKTTTKTVKTAVGKIGSKVLQGVKKTPIVQKATGAVSKIGTKILGNSAKAFTKTALKRLPMIGNLITAGGAVMEAYGANKKFNAIKDQIESRNDLSKSEKKEMIREAENNRNESYGKAAGSAIGASAGMAIGATLGSVIPVFGTAIGGIVGGWLGEKAGSFIGGTIGKHANDVKDVLFSRNDATDVAEPKVSSTTNISNISENGESSNIVEDKLLYNKTNDIYKLLVNNFSVVPNDKIYSSIESKPIVGDRTVINTFDSYRENNTTMGGNINLNINGTLKLDVPSINKTIDFDLEKLTGSTEFKEAVNKLIITHMSSFGGLRNRENSSYRGGAGASYAQTFLS